MDEGACVVVNERVVEWWWRRGIGGEWGVRVSGIGLWVMRACVVHGEEYMG